MLHEVPTGFLVVLFAGAQIELIKNKIFKMAKRRQRITPKISKRPRKEHSILGSNSTCSDSVDESKVESVSSSKSDKKVMFFLEF